MRKNYRKKYEDITGVKIPQNHEIHHIDFNRENNEILNLVCLPKELHNKYHSTRNEILKTKIFDTVTMEDFCRPVSFFGGTYSYWIYSQLGNLYKSLEKLSEYENEILGFIQDRNLILKIKMEDQLEYETNKRQKRRCDGYDKHEE